MTREAGRDGNETLSATIDPLRDCVELYYRAVDADGDEARYPSDGALLIGPGCTDAYTATATPEPSGPLMPADLPDEGCSATGPSGGGFLPLLLLLGLVPRRR